MDALAGPIALNQTPLPLDAATAWDARVDRALAAAPRRLGRAVDWLRAPRRRWVRLGAGVLLILGGLLSILPVFGLWMLPLGLALLGEDSPGLKAHLERAAAWIERRIAGVRRRRTR